MIKIPKEQSDVPRKQEDSSSNYAKAKASSSWSSMEQQWVRLKDPRIVRVARSCGGKDRHSKVCTIRGLRDRRVRLSVPTAIQLYDLQERLGFNQPSKVIDWLLDAAKNDIDELPPLPPLNLALLHHHAILTSNNNSQPNKEEEAAGGGWEASNNNTTFWKLIEPKEASSSHEDNVKQGSNNDNDQLSHHAVQVVPHHHHHPSFVGYQWEGSGSGDHVSHQRDLQSINVAPFSSTLSLSTGDSSHHHHHHHHHFASHFGANMDMDHNNMPRQVNYNNQHYPMMLQGASSNLYPISMAQSLNKPFGLSMMTHNNTSDHQSHHQSQNHLQNFPTK